MWMSCFREQYEEDRHLVLLRSILKVQCTCTVWVPDNSTGANLTKTEKLE